MGDESKAKLLTWTWEHEPIMDAGDESFSGIQGHRKTVLLRVSEDALSLVKRRSKLLPTS